MSAFLVGKAVSLEVFDQALQYLDQGSTPTDLFLSPHLFLFPYLSPLTPILFSFSPRPFSVFSDCNGKRHPLFHLLPPTSPHSLDLPLEENAVGGMVSYRKTLASSFLLKFFLYLRAQLGLSLPEKVRTNDEGRVKGKRRQAIRGE